MKFAHEQDPSSTLTRLQEQLVLAHQLIGTARGKTIAAAIEGLIVFTARISPGLALSMLEREEPWIYRAIALHRLILALLQVQGIELRWVQALVATMGRWEDYREYNDHTKPAMFAVYSSALHQHDYEVVRRAYDMARYVFVVEKECPSDLGRWATTWAETGSAPPDVLQDRDEYGTTQVPDSEPSGSDSDTDEPGWTEDLERLAGQDLVAFEKRLDEIADERFIRGLRRELDRVYLDWRTIIGQAMGRALSEDDDQVLNACFAELVAEICPAPVVSIPAAREATHAALRRFVERTTERLDAALTVEEFEQLFDVDAWLDSFVYRGTARYFHNRELEKRIQGWIEAAPLAKVHAWEDFCRRRCQGETMAVGLLAVGRRVAATEPQRAIDILVDAWKGFAEFFHMHGPLASEICSAVMRLGRERGCELLFESFRQQYQRYPESIIYALDWLLDFSSDLPAFDAVRLYEIWSAHNRRLVAGLSAKPVDMSWLADDGGGEFRDRCLRYLLDLFDYPVVDVRRLVLEQLFCLAQERHELGKSILDWWPKLSSGQKEYVASLLFSLGIANPAFMEDWAPRLVEIVQRERHYNLRATIAEAVSAGVDYGAELDLSLVTEARALKSAPRIMQPPSLLARSGQRVRYPPYLRWALGLLDDVAPPGALESRTRAILAWLYPQPERGFEAEVAIHRRYNINTNFDVIEIGGDYDRAVREAMNLALHELVQEHSVDEDTLGKTADVLRLYDPTDVLVHRVSRPGKITWIDGALSDEEFIRYADIDSLKERYAMRDERWGSLYEHTEQRIGDRSGADQTRASKVHLTVFGVFRGSTAPTLHEIDEEERYGVLASLRNKYRFELIHMESESSQLLSALGGRLVPIVQVSRRSFRGRHTPDVAAVVPELARTLGLERHDKDLLGYAIGGQQVVRSIEWQEAFDQGRRRHEPRSSGFLLEMDRGLLWQWADVRGVELWAHLVVERTIDRYKPESKMAWQAHTDVFALRIS